MPFVISSNLWQLDIVWKSDECAKKFNMNDIKEQYGRINIIGQNNEFTDYQIINRTSSLQISDCTLDLSQIKGNINQFNVSNCVCVNNLSDNLNICTLNINNSTIQESQLNNINLQYLNVNINRPGICYDYYNNDKVKCFEHKICITGIEVNLSKLSGVWDSVYFDNCTFRGEINNNILKVQTVHLIISQNNQENNLKSLESLVCNYFYLSQTQHEANYSIYLQMNNNNRQKTIMEAEIQNCECDLGQVQCQWTKIKFNNCKLIGNPKNYKKIFANTQIDVALDQYYKFPQDFSALYNIDTTLYMNLDNIQPDFRSINLCKPKYLCLVGCTFDFQQLVGVWKSVNVSQSYVSFTQSLIPKGSIITNSLIFEYFNYNYASSIVSNSLQISNSNLVKQFPNVKKLYIINSSINISTINNSIKYLAFYNPKFIRFSVLNLNALIAIDLNFISEDSPSFETRNAIINYIRFKKVFKNKSKQRLYRIQYEQNRIQNILNRIQMFRKILGAFSSSFDLNGRE
ncbi:Hypothetical_protein [Hexamita inflata]|uniref:Hypothetical_protein n=1 Tax=Hexamita inflata TaxID=28002 RepID=A0ABP1HPN1_9EUKA